jgi:DNA repair protein RadD
MFRQFLSELGTYNPKLKVVGLTATPYRLDSGRLWGKSELFSHLCYRADIRKLIDEGHLCNLVNKPSSVVYDTSGLHTRLGEFVRREMEDLFSDQTLAVEACKELIAKSDGRRSVLVFCSGVAHAEIVTEILSEMTGERVDCVTGETPALLREASLSDFSAGRFRFCVNVDVLTTGFDSPRIDCVGIMRATQSAGLFCQMVGRGLRTHESKQDALIVDFGGNLRRHGPIDSIAFGASKTKEVGAGDAPKKTCPGCGEVVAAGARSCECGFEFQFKKADHETQSDDESQILSEPETFEVSEWLFSRHFKKNAPDAPNTLRVTYFTPGDLGTAIEEWVCLNHEGFAGRKARQWWRDHTDEQLDDVMEMIGCDGVGAALEIEQRGYMKMPTEITAVRQGRFWRITGRVAGELRPKLVEEDIPF